MAVVVVVAAKEKKGGCGGEKVGEPASASIHVFSVVARYDPDVRS